MRVASLFAGVGGFEVGLERAGHETELVCEIDPPALEVLAARLPHVRDVREDVRSLARIPPPVELLVAGFPCINLSLAGYKEGIEGRDSALVHHVFRLLERKRVPTVVLENVPFMLQLGRGGGMLVLMEEFERLGYRWAYRVVNALGFGLPQRRERVFLVASRAVDPRTVLFADSFEEGPATPIDQRRACGFYWTEGIRGVGWADEALPTLKGGSTIGIPSPPAIWVSGAGAFLPDVRDAERMQGFAPDWTKPAERVARPGHRWKLIGNAVSTRVTEWLGRRLHSPGDYNGSRDPELDLTRTLPVAAWSDGRRRHHAVSISKWASRTARKALLTWLKYEPQPLSEKATRGFLSRAARSRLRFRAGFLEDLRAHADRMASTALAS